MTFKHAIVAGLTCIAGASLVARADPLCPAPTTPLRSDVRGAACPGDGFWGDWTDWQFCPPGTYVHSYHMRVEPKQGGGDIADGHDDTALNAVELQCVDLNGVPAPDPDGKLMPHPGWWGDWEGWAACPGPAGRMVAASLLLEPQQGGDSDEDDTAANAVKFLCDDGTTTCEAPHSVSWGNWSADWARCPSVPAGQAICGVQVRVEPKQGGGGQGHDDTAMNGARFACCYTGCCKLCTKGKPCGDTCIAATETCHQPPGCACKAPCPSGTTDCNGTCANTSADKNNCGSCGHACRADQVCQGGACVCPAPKTDCNGACADTSSDRNNCGSCGVPCLNGRDCRGSACVCQLPKMECNGQCVDITANNSYCGNCATACTNGQTCQGGVCR